MKVKCGTVDIRQEPDLLGSHSAYSCSGSKGYHQLIWRAEEKKVSGNWKKEMSSRGSKSRQTVSAPPKLAARVPWASSHCGDMGMF